MCALTYQAGRRIQGLSQDALTFQDDFSSDTWTSVGSTVTISGGNLSAVSVNTASDDRMYKALGTTLSNSAWVLQFDAYISSSSHTTLVGLGSHQGSLNAYDNILCDYDGSNIIMREYNGSSLGLDSTGISVSTGTQYYVTLTRTSDTGLKLDVRTGSHTGTLVGTETGTISNGTIDLDNIASGAYGRASGTATYNIDNIKIYNGVTTAGEYDTKPTNVQVGSRFEETDTRKMYYYNEPSQDFASVLSTYAPQFFLKLDEGTGTSLTNSGSNSGYTASITVDSSNPVWDTGVGGTNKALKFGNGSTDSYIGHTNLPTENTDNFTMGITFKISTDFTGGDSNHHHLWQWDNSGLGFWQMNMTNDGYIGTGYYNSGWQHLVGTTDSSDNAWHTFFLTCTSGSAVKGYLDGTQEFSGTANRSGYAGNDVDWIGHRGGNGTISYDNVFFKNSVLTASEISSLHDLLVPSTDNVWEELGT